MVNDLAGSGLTWNDVVSTWGSLDPPEGWRPEITPEGITMAPPRRHPHAVTVEEVHGALRAGLPHELGVYQNLGIALPDVGSIFIPDVTVAPRTALDAPEPLDASMVLLAVEVTSPNNAHHDRKRKLWAYAHGPIPHYLLIDPHDPEGPVTRLFSEPRDGVYSSVTTVPFQQTVTLVEQFSRAPGSSAAPGDR